MSTNGKMSSVFFLSKSHAADCNTNIEQRTLAPCCLFSVFFYFFFVKWQAAHTTILFGSHILHIRSVLGKRQDRHRVRVWKTVVQFEDVVGVAQNLCILYMRTSAWKSTKEKAIKVAGTGRTHTSTLLDISVGGEVTP